MSQIGTTLGVLTAIGVAAATWLVAADHAPAVSALLLWME